MVKEILKAIIVVVILYVLVVHLLPVLIPALATIGYWAISLVVVVITHFIAKTQGFPIFKD